MANGEEMLSVDTTEVKGIRSLSIVKVLEKTLNGKVDELLELQRKITRDLERVIEKLSM